VTIAGLICENKFTFVDIFLNMSGMGPGKKKDDTDVIKIY